MVNNLIKTHREYILVVVIFAVALVLVWTCGLATAFELSRGLAATAVTLAFVVLSVRLAGSIVAARPQGLRWRRPQDPVFRSQMYDVSAGLKLAARFCERLPSRDPVLIKRYLGGVVASLSAFLEEMNEAEAGKADE
jgi:hypothetical protein